MRPNPQPNIVWVQTDHHVWAHHRDLPDAFPRMPVFDRIAREGTVFPNAYTVCPLCTPARASTLTGLLPHRHGLHSNAHGTTGRFGNNGALREFRPTDPLISSLLTSAGYRVGYFGKWHCGEQQGPSFYGFDGWAPLSYGYPYGEAAYRHYLDRRGLSPPRARILWSERPEIAGGATLDLCSQPGWFAMGGGLAVLDGPEETHEAFFVADLAVRWMETAAREGRPFFVRIDPWGPHPPYVLDPDSLESIDHKTLPVYPGLDWNLTGRPEHHRDYRRMWAERTGFDVDRWRYMRARAYEHAALVDRAIGTVVQALGRLGIADRTAVYYTSDHGDIIGTNGGTSNKGPIMVEENVRIPLAVRIPGTQPRVDRHLVSNMDLFATSLELAGIDVPPGSHSSSLVPLALNRDVAWRNALLLEHHGMRTPCFQRGLRWDRYKLIAQKEGFLELYDLDTDPFEMRNLADDPAWSEILEAGRRRLKNEMTASEDDSVDARELALSLEMK